MHAQTALTSLKNQKDALLAKFSTRSLLEAQPLMQKKTTKRSMQAI